MPTIAEVFALSFVAGIGLLTAHMAWLIVWGTVSALFKKQAKPQ